MTQPGGPGVVLSIDFGSRTTVGVLTEAGAPRLVGVDGQPWIQSAVYADDGGLVVGTDAVRMARLDPTRFEPSPKRRIDEGEVLLGAAVLPVDQLIDAVIGKVVAEARRQLGDRPIDGLVLTHPADWANVRQEQLRRIGSRYAPRLVLVPEPVAAAMYFAATSGFPVGASLAVYDLGAGTFDAAVVRRSPQGFEVLATDGLNDLGGMDMDQRLFDFVGRKAREQNADAWAEITGENGGSSEQRRRLRSLRDDIVAAKETLSRRTEIDIPFPSPFSDVHVTREEYEELIRADLERSVEVLSSTIAAAGTTPEQLHSVHFVGGATRTPLCAQLVSARLGVQPVPIDQPETVVALGAARAVLPPPGQQQTASGRTGTYAAVVGDGRPTINQDVPRPHSMGIDGPRDRSHHRPIDRPHTGGMPVPPPGPPRPATGGVPAPYATGSHGTYGPPSGGHPARTGAHPVQPGPQTGSWSQQTGSYGAPSGSYPAQQAPRTASKKPLLLAGIGAVVVIGLVVWLVVGLSGGGDDTTASPSAPAELSKQQAADLVRKVLPKDPLPKGYTIEDGGENNIGGYTDDPTDINTSKAGFVCIPQQDSPLPAESGKVAVQSLNAVEDVDVSTLSRPRDQIFIDAIYMNTAQRGKLLGEIRTKITDCIDKAPTATYDTYEFADEVSGISGEQVGFTTTLPVTADGGGGGIDQYVTCQIARVDALVLRSCAISSGDDDREPTGLGGDAVGAKDRSLKTADFYLEKLVGAAKKEQGL